MTNDDNVVQPGSLDVADDGCDPVRDRERPQVAWLAPAPWQVNGEHGEIRFQPAEFVDGQGPAVTRVATARDDYKRGECHRVPFDLRRQRSTSISASRCGSLTIKS